MAVLVAPDEAEVCSVDAHLVERLGVHDVEDAASVHQYFCEPLWANDRVDDKRVPSRVRDRAFNVGDLVLRLMQSNKDRHKLSPPWEGRTSSRKYYG